MPIPIKDIINNPISKRLGLLEEEFVKEKMEKLTGLKFSRKKRLFIGTKLDGNLKYHNFDLVSEDGSIIIEVKSGKGIVGEGNRNSAGISTCFHDCYLLTKVQAKKKILALTDKDMFDIFIKESDGIINKDAIEVRYFNMKK